ncbi:MAG: short-chain dehydrogenase [Acidobacteria bacterium]|nr:MAG: short-chain dehydrogenase [Acidobacteriota bacterium]
MSTLADRVSVVTGSTSGIGRGIAEHFASLGSNVVVHGRDRADGLETVRRVKAAGREAEYVDGDLTREDVCRSLIRFAVERFGGLDILVNNAADTGRGDLEHIPVARWDTIMAVNLRAPFILLQESIAPMRARGGGSIVNIGSVLAYVGEPKLGAYSVSKGGLMTLTKNAASLLNRDRIRVNQINVGWTLTEGERRVKREEEGKNDDWIAQAIATRPFGRLLAPIDIAYAAAYFASDESGCVTGSVLDLEQYPPGALANS